MFDIVVSLTAVASFAMSTEVAQYASVGACTLRSARQLVHVRYAVRVSWCMHIGACTLDQAASCVFINLLN